jgi:hypothetical protein
VTSTLRLGILSEVFSSEQMPTQNLRVESNTGEMATPTNYTNLKTDLSQLIKVYRWLNQFISIKLIK